MAQSVKCLVCAHVLAGIFVAVIDAACMRLQETDHLTAGLTSVMYQVHTCIDDGWSSIVITEQDVLVSPMHLPDVSDMYAVIDYDGICTSHPL